jgi:helix-turn-helix protein
MYEEPEEKQEASRPTLAAIENKSQIEIKLKENPFKQHLLDDFIASLPEIVESEQKVKEIIR